MGIFRKKPNKLDQEIERIYEAMKVVEPASEEYSALTARLDDLQKLKKSKKWHVNPDTVFAGGVNLAGILLVLKHEELKVISSKAFGLVKKVK